MSAKKPSRPSPTASRRPRWLSAVLIIGLGLIVGLGLIALVEYGRNRPVGQDAGSLPATRTNSHVLDSVGKDAPTLVEFLDFECEACSALHPVVQEIRTHYQGKINYVIRYFPLSGHKNAVPAALAVEAAAQQGKIEEMANMLLETQAAWGEQADSKAPLFRTYAEKIGLDMARYDAAVADQATLKRIQQDFDDGTAIGVQSTPTFILDGKVLTLNKLSDLTDPIDQAIAAAGTKR